MERAPIPVRHFAESLQRMLGKTEIPQILTIGAVSVRKTCSVYADFAERFPADQLAGKQRLRKANHVFSRGKQPGVTAEIAARCR